MFFFFKQKTAYEMRISDWSSDVCSSDLRKELAILQKIKEGLSNREIALKHRISEDTVKWHVHNIFSTFGVKNRVQAILRSEEHTSELQSLLRISYAVFCLKKKSLESENLSLPQLYSHTPPNPQPRH